MIVIACNTVSAVALEELESVLTVPVCGVDDPGARQAILLAQGHTIAVIATEATIGSDAYRRAMNRYQPSTRVIQKSCPLFVPLVEEGRRCEDAITKAIVRDYLEPIMRLDPKVMVMGCTHYPLLKPAIAEFVGPDVKLVDSGEQMANSVVERLRSRGGLAEGDAGSLTCYVSDNPQRFRELGQRFLDHAVVDVTWVSHEQLVAQDSAAV
jgi:glutamate racemase